MNDDCTYATITVNGIPNENYGYGVNYAAEQPEHGNYVSDAGQSIRLINGKPALMYRWANWEDNGPQEDLSGDLRTSYDNAPGFDNTLFFYFVNGDNETLVKPDKITSSNETIVKVFKHPENEDAAIIQLVGFGDAFINYTLEETTYQLKVSSILPQIGFYTTPVASEDSYIRSFDVTEDNDTFYLIARDGLKITRADLMNDFSEIANCTLDKSGDFATIQITGTPENNVWYEIDVESYYPDHDRYDNYSVNIKLTSSKPMLVFDWEGDFNTIYRNSKGVSMDFAFFLIDNGNETLVTAKDLVSGDENIIRVSECSENKDLVNLELVGWGKTTLSYTAKNGKTYSIRVVCELPPVGFYSAPSATEDNYIGQKFTLTNRKNTFYLISRDDWTFESFAVEEYWQGITRVTVSNDKKMLTISITGDLEESHWFHVELNEAHGYGIEIIPNNTQSEKPPVAEFFVDVVSGAWYEESIQYVFNEGIIIGDGDVFAPDNAATRAMVATILYRLAGSPEVTDYTLYNQFKDLPQEHLWYSDAVAWALNAGVSTGDPYNMRYNPTSPVTREQLAVFLRSYAKYADEDITVTAPETELFGDTFVNDWAKEGFGWAVDRGIIKGAEEKDSAGNTYYVLNPQGGATRAQLARVLHRYLGGAVD